MSYRVYARGFFLVLHERETVFATKRSALACLRSIVKRLNDNGACFNRTPDNPLVYRYFHWDYTKWRRKSFLALTSEVVL